MKTYYDELHVRASLIDFPSDSDDKYLELILALPGGAVVDLDELTDAIENISRIDPAHTQQPFLIEQTRSHVSWGSDSAIIGYVIDIAVGLGAAGLYDGISRVIRKYRVNLQEPAQVYAEAELIELARQAVTRHFGYSRQFKATGLTRLVGPEVSVVNFVDEATGSTQVEVRIIEGVPVITRHYRELP